MFWGAGVADMLIILLISKYNQDFRFLLCVIDIFSKYAKVVPLKNKKDVIIVDAVQRILGDLERKPNKLWVNQGSEFYNRFFKKWLDNNYIKMHSTHNER